MSRPSRRRRRRSSRDLRAGVVGAVLGGVALLGLAGLGYVYATADAPPTLDAANLCPVGGARGVTVVLLDNSDPMPEVTMREVSTHLSDLAETLPSYALLEIRLLDPEKPAGRVVFSKCNPGDGSNLSRISGNPAMARKRWLEGFRTPVQEALAGGLRPAPSKWSPIMAAIQGIAVDRFDGRALDGVPKTLVVVSDMLENGPDYSQYAGDLGFERFRAMPAYAKLRPDLKGAAVRLLYVQRLKGRDPLQHVRFWEAWVKDGNGHLSEAVRLQGAS